MWPSERLLLEIHIQQWMGCSDAMAHSFGQGRTRVSSRRSASVCPSISRAGRFQDADLVLFRFPIASSLIGIKWGFVFISLLTSRIWVLHLFFCLCVSYSGKFPVYILWLFFFLRLVFFSGWLAGGVPCIPDINPMSAADIANTFPHSVHYQLSPCCPSQNIININTVKIVHVYVTTYTL